jgi:transcriptional regulator with XRE-family HTH domain
MLNINNVIIHGFGNLSTVGEAANLVQKHCAGRAMDTSKSDDQFDLGKRIRQLREKAGLSIRKLGRLAGIDHSTIARIEQNEASPTANSLELICNALNIPMAYLWFSGDEDKDKTLREALKAVFYDLPPSATEVMEAKIRFVERRYRIKTQATYRPIYYLGGQYKVKVFDEHWINPTTKEHLYVTFEPGGSVEGWTLPTAIVPAATEDEADQPWLGESQVWSSIQDFKSYLEKQGFCWNEYPLCAHFDEYCQEDEDSMRQLKRIPT